MNNRDDSNNFKTLDRHTIDQIGDPDSLDQPLQRELNSLSNTNGINKQLSPRTSVIYQLVLIRNV
jgi:hypothetical protein